MAKAAPIQTDFSAGELSPLLKGRVDIGRYKSGLETCLNFLPTIQGSLVRRSGTRYVADVKTSSKATRLVEFEFSTTQAYIIEFGDQYVRFYKDNGQIQSGGSPYEVTTSYLEADLFDLKFTQSADVLYIVHPDYPPATLSRTSDTSWTLAEMDFYNGPFLALNTTATTMTPSATTGAGTTVTITASSATGINNDNGFNTNDSFTQLIRIKHGAVWGWGYQNGYTSPTQISVLIVSPFGATTASAFWHEAAWGDNPTYTKGYPSTVTFHEDRLAFAGSPTNPQRIDMSETGEYDSFKPTESDTSVLATNALSFSFNSNKVNAVKWILSDEKGLFSGTTGGEWLIRAADNSGLTPTNITAKLSTKYGSENIQAIQSGKSAIFVERSGRKLRELGYFFDVDGFRAMNLTEISEHITQGGIKEIASQQNPQPFVWCLKNDGVLTAITYERTSDGLRAGWHRHIVGGVSDAAGSPAEIESVAVIPAPSADKEELWVVVKRYVNGAVVRHIEYLEKIFDDPTDQKDAFFVDAGLTYDAPVTISGVTLADPGVVTATSHGFSDGNKVLITEVKGMGQVNGQRYLVSNSTAHTFELQDLDSVNVDTSGYTTYVSGGEVRKYITSLSGLDHLEGESVTILTDGATHPNKVVSSGAITLDHSATTVHIGYGYNSDAKMMRLNNGSRDGTAIGKTQRTHRVGIMLHRSLGIQLGFDFEDLDEITFRTFGDNLSAAPPLFTGIISETVEGDYDFENQLCVRQSQALPLLILAIMPQLMEYDR